MCHTVTFIEHSESCFFQCVQIAYNVWVRQIRSIRLIYNIVFRVSVFWSAAITRTNVICITHFTRLIFYSQQYNVRGTRAKMSIFVQKNRLASFTANRFSRWKTANYYYYIIIIYTHTAHIHGGNKAIRP